MNKIILTMSVLFLAIASSNAYAGNFGQPSQDWNANWGFKSPGQQSVDLQRSVVIERAENGGFNSTYYTTNNVTNSSVTYCQVTDTCDTNIENQTTSIGAVTNNTIDDSPGATIADNVNLNNGNVAASTTSASGGGDANSSYTQ